MMPAAQASLIPQLVQALRHISADQYVETVRRITDFFIAGAHQFNERHVHMFDCILGRFLAVIETEGRVELARRLAPVPNAPREVVRRLARDTIAVAAPVLTRSLRLDEADLVEIAGTAS